MASVTATGNISNVNVSATTNTISVTDTLSNIAVSNISSQTVNVAVTSTATTVNVAQLAAVANSTIRPAISVTTTGGSLGSLGYNVLTGVINLNGPFDSDVRAAVSGTAPITFNSSTGVIGIDSAALFTGKTTDDLAEGSTNLYFNGKNTDGLAEGSTNQYYTTARSNSAIAAYQGDINTPGNITAKSVSVTDKIFSDLQGNITKSAYVIKGHNKYHFVSSFTAVEIEDGTFNGLPYFGRSWGANAATMPSIGITTETSTLGGNANITVFGEVTFSSSGTTHFTTGMPIAGDEVFVTADAGSAGLFSNVKPAGGNVVQQIATVLMVDGSNITMHVDASQSQLNIASSDDVPEGATNLYFSTARANAAIADYSGAMTNMSGNLTTTGIATFGNSASQTHNFTGNVNVTGNIEVDGNLNYRNVEDLYVRDQMILLNANATTDATSDIKIFRPVAGANAILRWNETTDKWTFSNGGVFYDIPTSTSDLAEGTNLYFSNARAIAQANIAIGTNTTDNLSEGSTNLYYSNARVLNYVTRSGGITGNILLAGDFTTTTGGGATGKIIAPLLEVGTAGSNPGSGASHPLVVDSVNVAVRYNFTANTHTDLNVLGDSLVLNTRAGAGTKADANAFIVVDREVSGSNAQIKWNETTDRWQINNGSGYLDILGGTSGITDANISGVVVQAVRNETGSTLTKGQAVYLTGANTGDNPHVALADANDAAKMPALGIIYENIANASNGHAVISGEMNYSSHGFALGSDLFISTTAGALTVTKPTGENSQIQKIGKSVGTNHILVQGAFRSNQTPNLNQGNIFLGDTNNQTRTVTPSTNFKTTSNAFTTANALTNINSISSEAGHDRLTIKALLGGANTSTVAGNITSDGYEVILDSSHTYASSGNISQQGSNNLNGYAVSGSFTSGSNAMTITGVTELKNVFNGTGVIDGTNNNTGLTSSMVANMIMDNWNGVDGSQYPLPQGTTLVSASASTLVFSENAVANQTFANAEPIAIVHGGRDAKNGQLISFVSQDDATPDGTNIQNIDNFAGFTTLTDNFESPVGNETGTTIIIGNFGGASVPLSTGTPLTMANVVGPGNGNINGVTFYYGRDVFSDGTMFTLFTSADGTTTPADGITLGIQNPAQFDGTDTRGGDYTYTSAQSTTTISKARLYKEDAYGYPLDGPSSSDFAYTTGSASDYTIDITGAGGYGNAGNDKSIRGRTSLEALKQVLKAPIGLTIGENTTMSNRGDGDALTNFGLNFVWDGLTDYSTLYAGTTSNIVPQMLFKSYTDNTFASGASGKGRGGPRLFFAPSTGNINTSEFDKYPRKSQEIGRMTFWGPTQSAGDGMSTVNPPGFISATASEDWTTSNKLEMSFAANGNGANNADVFLNYRNGQVVLGSATNGTTQQPIHFAPAVTTTTGNAAQTYATLGHTWANVNYANVSAQQGSKFTITQGTTAGANSGDLTLAFDREYIAGTATGNIATQADAGLSTLTDQFESPVGNETSATIVLTTPGGGAPTDLTTGTALTFSGILGAGNTSINGQTYYVGRQVFGGFGMYTIFKSSDGTTTPLTTSDVAIVQPAAYDATGTGAGQFTYTVTGTSARDYTFNLPVGSEDLVLSTNGTTHSTFYNNGNLQVSGNIEVGAYKLPTADGTSNQVIKTDGAGNLSFTTISGTGTVTNIASGNGLTGGPITTTGTLTVGAGNGITVNATNVAINTSVVADLDSTQIFTGAKTLDVVTLKQFNETVVNLGSQSGDISAVAAFNAANASIFTLTATGGITISSIPNVQTGGSYTVKVIQDGTGSHALTSTFKYAGGDKTLSTAGGSIDVINVVYDGTDYLATLSKAYA